MGLLLKVLSRGLEKNSRFDFDGWEDLPLGGKKGLGLGLSVLTLPSLSESTAGIIICICFFFGRMQCSWTDLMIEACYTEKMKDVPGPVV